MGLVEEGQEVMAEGEEKEDAAADLALIGAAQRVEHYEMSAYTTAKNLAQQLRHSARRRACCRSRWPKRRTRISCSTRWRDR